MEEIFETRERNDKRDKAIYQAIKEGQWFTLGDLNEVTGYPTATASATVRNFRKVIYGSNTVDRRYLGNGVYQYRFIKNTENNIIEEKLG